MPQTDLLPLVRKLLAAYDRGNSHDLHTTIAELRAVAGLDEAPGNDYVATLKRLRTATREMDTLIDAVTTAWEAANESAL